MESQVPIDSSARPDEEKDGWIRQVLPDLAYQRVGLVNVVFYGRAGSPGGRWVLVDAGVMGTTRLILDAAADRYGEGSRPACIVLTHGHFDHVGALPELARRWDVPVFAHALERPYLNGDRAYPPPDPSVGGGMMARLSPLYPRGPIDVQPWLQPLPADGSVPGMPGWVWIHTPGHTVGHVSLWRPEDRALIAGDAFITTRQESAYSVATQRTELHGPPMYFTPDWKGARESVERLAALEPRVAVTGHGRALEGPLLRDGLHTLAREFDEVAVPGEGRYVDPLMRP